jgi:putative ABC transport system permease protein
MIWLRVYWRRLRGLFGKGRLERELQEEIDAHLQMQSEEYERQGMSAEQARLAALRQFGGVEQVKERYRDRRGLPAVETTLQDVRYAGRVLRKSPGFTAVAVVTLALGIGASTAIFSIVNAVLLNPLPFAEPERLVMIYGKFLSYSQSNMSVSVPEFVDCRERTSSFAQLAAYDDFSANLTAAAGEPERVEALAVTPELFAVLQAAPLYGRVFLPEEAQEGRDDVVIISHELWQRRFAADPNAVGQQVIVNGRNHTVVGVMPQGFAFPQRTRLWKPLWFPAEQYAPDWRGSRGLTVISRLKPNVSLAVAQAEVDQLAAQLTGEYPRNYESRGYRISLVPLLADLVGETRKGLLVLLGAVAFVTLIACANVANLLLARGAGRRQEIAVRLALGARRGRIVRQLLTESLLLAGLGGALGLLLATWGVDLLLSFAPQDLPRLHEVRLDGRVLAFTFAVALLTGVLFGLAPALATSGADLNETLKEGRRGATGGARRLRLRRAFVITEVALALVLLVGAGLLLKSFWRLQGVDPGFNADGVLTMRLMLPFEIYQKPAQRSAFYRQILERINAVPGVEAAGAAAHLPLRQGGMSGTISAENSAVGPNDLPVEVDWNWVTPDYFKTMEIALLGGRAFTEADTEGAARVAIIDESFARTFFPNQDPVGKRLKRGKLDSTRPWMTIIGVVRQVHSHRLEAAAREQVYFPFYQDPSPYNMSLIARTSAAGALSLSLDVRSAIQSVDPNQPVFDVFTLRQVVGDSMAERRFSMLLMAVFAAVALTLAAVGIYGVMAYAVAQRTHEIGIRVALGATAGSILRLIVGQGMALTLTGVGIGLLAALALTRLLASLLYSVSATDPLTFAVIALLLTGVALLACWLPARRATKVDPMVALRYE